MLNNSHSTVAKSSSNLLPILSLTTESTLFQVSFKSTSSPQCSEEVTSHVTLGLASFAFIACRFFCVSIPVAHPLRLAMHCDFYPSSQNKSSSPIYLMTNTTGPVRWGSRGSVLTWSLSTFHNWNSVTSCGACDHIGSQAERDWGISESKW